MIIGSGGKDVLGMTPPVQHHRRCRRGAPHSAGLFCRRSAAQAVVGKANDAQKRAFAVYAEALEAGIAAVRPGVRAAPT